MDGSTETVSRVACEGTGEIKNEQEIGHVLG